MCEDIQIMIDDIIKQIDNDPRMIELKRLKSKLLDDKDFMNNIREIQNNRELLFLKKKDIFKNKDYQRYQLLENDISFLTLEINKRFNQLTDSKGCIR